MKSIHCLLGILTIFLSISLTSCSLEEEPQYSLNTNTVFNDRSTAETALMQSYGHLGSSSLYGQFIHEVTIANGFSWAKTDGERRERTVGYDTYAEEGLLSAVWQGFYKVIAESNYLIDGLGRSSLSQDYIHRSVAHARFLRGFAYYKLANLFGKAIVITDPISTSNLHSALSERELVYEQALSDLIFASENLPLTESMDGLATKSTAIAFVSKCYWLMGNHAQAQGNDGTQWYELAKKYGDQVLSAYSLEPNFENLWASHVANSPESIFQINFTLAEGIQNRSTFNFAPNTGWGGFAANSPSWGNYRVDRAFYDFHRGTYPDDPRMNTTYLTSYVNNKSGGEIQYSYPYIKFNDWSTGVKVETLYDMYADAPRNAGDTPTNPDYNFEGLPDPVLAVWESTYGWDRNLWPYNKKMTSVEASNNYDPKNIIIFRYADLLLLMADVENELGNSNLALSYLNRVLTRARESGDGAVYPMNQGVISQDELRDKIYFERLFELAGEPCLFEDIRRRGTDYLREIMELHNNSKNVKFRYEFEAANGVGGQFRDYEIKNISEDFVRKNLVLPIPADEITSNEELSLEDQNFGY